LKNLRRQFKLGSVKINSCFIILSACLFAGCSADKETIHFSDEHLQRPDDPITAVAADPEKLSKQDLFKVKLAVYGDLLQRHFWDAGEYSAVFVQGTDEEVDAVVRKFPNHVPPIKPSNHAQLLPNRTPLDKDTGKPAMILSVDALDPEDGMVQAVGRWYAGGAVSGFYTFSLRKSSGDWVIESFR
jgi:hypothetical protein